MKRAWTQVGELWCRHMHPAPMWPVKGRYQCPTCLRAYPVAWEQGSVPAPSASGAGAPGGARMVAPVLSRQPMS